VLAPHPRLDSACLRARASSARPSMQTCKVESRGQTIASGDDLRVISGHPNTGGRMVRRSDTSRHTRDGLPSRARLPARLELGGLGRIQRCSFSALQTMHCPLSALNEWRPMRPKPSSWRRAGIGPGARSSQKWAFCNAFVPPGNRIDQAWRAQFLTFGAPPWPCTFMCVC
jgi:hypothetical protein